jgi:hypothetical protein
MAEKRPRDRCVSEAEAKWLALGGDPAARFVPYESEAASAEAPDDVPPECRPNGAMVFAAGLEGAARGMADKPPQGPSMVDRQWEACERAKDRAALRDASRAGQVGCRTDVECKGDRICESGRCVAPR